MEGLELVVYRESIRTILYLEPEIRMLYPDLGLPNHFKHLLRELLREISLKLIEVNREVEA